MAFLAPDWFLAALQNAAADPALGEDPRWARFLDTETECATCGITSPGLVDIGFDHPDVWPHGNFAAADGALMEIGRDRLSARLCRFEEAHFLRCLLPLPLAGHDGYVCFEPWARVAREHFEAYTRATMPPFPPFEGCEAVLANALPGTDPRVPVPCALFAANPQDPPALFPHEGPLRAAQQGGISFNSLLEIYAATGLDLRAHLAEPAEGA